MICSLCPRKCRALRTDNENLNGYCKMPLLPKAARADLHFWEEPCISGKNGSGTVFFSGCALSCVYCQNFEVSHNALGKEITYERLAEIFCELEKKGAHNINLVSPTHYALAIKNALDIYRPNIPVIYNSSGYERAETLKMLEGYIDIYLLDLKYLSSQRAELYSNAADYPEYATAAIKEALRQQPNCEIYDGIMQKGVIIRHLLMPQATKEAISVFDWVRENASAAYFSIMSQYIPFGKALDMPIINRKVTDREYNKVLDYICSFDFPNVFIQQKNSASKKYIPEFDLIGI